MDTSRRNGESFDEDIDKVLHYILIGDIDREFVYFKQLCTLYTQSGLSTSKISTDENSKGQNRRQESNQKFRSIFRHFAKQYVKAGESEKAVTFERYAEERKE